MSLFFASYPLVLCESWGIYCVSIMYSVVCSAALVKTNQPSSSHKIDWQHNIQGWIWCGMKASTICTAGDSRIWRSDPSPSPTLVHKQTTDVFLGGSPWRQEVKSPSRVPHSKKESLIWHYEAEGIFSGFVSTPASKWHTCYLLLYISPLLSADAPSMIK